MPETKLVKSFILIEDVLPSRKGDIITIKRSQALIGLSIRELYFQNEENNQNLSFGWIIDNMHKFKPKSYFKNLEEKFSHIS